MSPREREAQREGLRERLRETERDRDRDIRRQRDREKCVRGSQPILSLVPSGQRALVLPCLPAPHSPSCYLRPLLEGPQSLTSGLPTAEAVGSAVRPS